jgi:hypothetical protein
MNPLNDVAQKFCRYANTECLSLLNTSESKINNKLGRHSYDALWGKSLGVNKM